MGQKRLTGDFAPVTVISENRKDDRKRNMIKHVLFDLDGTLLPMDQNEFVTVSYTHLTLPTKLEV